MVFKYVVAEEKLVTKSDPISKLGWSSTINNIITLAIQNELLEVMGVYCLNPHISKVNEKLGKLKPVTNISKFRLLKKKFKFATLTSIYYNVM